MTREVTIGDALSPRARTETLKSGCTVRAFGTGAVVSFLINVGAPYGNMALRGSYMALDFSTAAAIFAFFLVVGGLLSRRLSTPISAMGSHSSMSRRG